MFFFKGGGEGRTNERPETDHVTLGPMKGLTKKLHLMAQTDKQKHGHSNSMTKSVKKIIKIKMKIKKYT